jgi:hypothetical protein
LVVVFLALNAVVAVVGLVDVFATPDALQRWIDALGAHGNGVFGVIGPAILAFPLLVLGLSGFETGVSMMPLVSASGKTPEERLESRVRNTRKLLTTAALIMSVYLIATSFITTVLVPQEKFAPGGPANGRALAYLAHELLGSRLRECARLVARIDGRTAEEIFGWPDDMKLRSSMTLFARAADDNAEFVAVLDKFYGGEEDPATLARLT